MPKKPSAPKRHKPALPSKPAAKAKTPAKRPAAPVASQGTADAEILEARIAAVVAKDAAEKAAAAKAKSDAPAKKIKHGDSDRMDTKNRWEVAKSVFFDKRDAGYFFPLAGSFVKLSMPELCDEFQAVGLSDDKIAGQGLDEFRWVRRWARHNNQVEFAGPLAGYRKGRQLAGGRWVLVTEEPSGGVFADYPAGPVKPPRWIVDFIRELLGDEQAEVLFYWLHFALAALRRGDFGPGQALIFAGESECGKSLAQYLITQVLGGRVADPMDYLTDRTAFNKKMTEAEHWQVEDLKSSTDGRARRDFGETLKRCVINERFTVHAKGKDGLDLPLFRRLTLSINRELENLGKCPPMDPSLTDKVMLFECQRAEMTLRPFIPDGLPNAKPDRLAIQRRIADELHAFRWWLTMLPPIAEGWTIHHAGGVAPASDSRMGVRSWHHPALFSELSSVDPWERMLQLTDAILWGDAADVWAPWEGKAIELEEKLRGNPRFAFEVEKVLRGANAAGSYLGRLGKRYPERITHRTVNGGYTVWTINPPPKTERE